MLYGKLCIGLLVVLAQVLPGCTFKQEGSAPPTARAKNLHQTQPLDQEYRIIVVEPVAIPVDMARQYPQAARSCQSSAIHALNAKKAFQLVHHTAPEQPGSPVLLVRSKITDMRLASRTGRLWPASSAASSYINMNVQLVDAGSRKVLQEKQLSTISAIPVSPDSVKNGQSDITKTMGALLGDYVFTAMPGKKP